MTDPIAALRSQLQQLQARHASGAIGVQEYEQEKVRLERTLPDQLVAPAADAAETVVRPAVRLVAGLWVVALVFAVAGYTWTGSPSLITGQVPIGEADGLPHASSAVAAEFEAAVERLAGQLKEQPDNAQGWAVLAGSLPLSGSLTS